MVYIKKLSCVLLLIFVVNGLIDVNVSKTKYNDIKRRFNQTSNDKW
jgi:hypothetical protein